MTSIKICLKKRNFKTTLYILIVAFGVYGCGEEKSIKELYQECVENTPTNYSIVGAIIGAYIPPHIPPAILFGGVGWVYAYLTSETSCKEEFNYNTIDDKKKSDAVSIDKYSSGSIYDEVYKDK